MDFVTFSVIFFSLLFAIDILYSKKSRIISFNYALIWSAVWIIISLIFIFTAFEVFKVGSIETLLSAYLTEKILSVNNLAAFLLIFSIAKINVREKSKALSFGIYLSILGRIFLIIFGIYLIETLAHFSNLLIAIILFISSFLMIKEKEIPLDRLLIKLHKFFTKNKINSENGKLLYSKKGTQKEIIIFTLISIGIANVIFAFDSIFAILAITSNFLILVTTNILAVLGLRPLYFLLENAVNKLSNLKFFLGFYLLYLAIASLLEFFYIQIPDLISLIVLLSSIILALLSEEFLPSLNRKVKIKQKS